MCMFIKKIKNDKSFKKFLRNKNLSKATIMNYAVTVKQFTEANNKDFTTIIKEIKEQDYDRIEEGRIIKYDPDYGLISEYVDTFIEYLQDRNNKNTSINLKLLQLKIVLRSFNIDFPTMPDFEDDTDEWYLLTKEDIKYVLSISNTPYKALITFLASSGLRIGDVCDLTIQDFMNATYSSHHINDFKEFLDKAPKDMVGFYNILPNKTKQHKIRCITGNTPESSNYILLMIRERYKKLKTKNIELYASDPLFGSNQKNYKEKVTPPSIAETFISKSKDLKLERERVLKSKLENGELNQLKYDKLINESPRFHAHALRKFFISTVALNIGNLRVCSLMEGHTPPSKLDRNYVKFDEGDIKEAYLGIIDCLCFEDVVVDFLHSSEKEEMEQRIRGYELEKKAWMDEQKVIRAEQEKQKELIKVLMDDMSSSPLMKLKKE